MKFLRLLQEEVVEMLGVFTMSLVILEEGMTKTPFLLSFNIWQI